MNQNMRFSDYILSVLVLLFLARVYIAATEPISPRIANGINATEGKYPFMAALMYGNHYRCGGSILTAQWILTAAHCVYSLNITLFSAYFGTAVIDGTRGTGMLFAEMIVHAEYQHGDNFPNDIALMKLETSLLFTPLVQPVVLPCPTQKIESSTPVIIMGWGQGQHGNRSGSATKYLQEAHLLVVNNDECTYAYMKNPKLRKRILPNQFCAGRPEGGVGQCTGDSGGPAVVAVNGCYIQLGIISFSAKPCGTKGYPGVFTSLPHHRYWIRSKTGL